MKLSRPVRTSDQQNLPAISGSAPMPSLPCTPTDDQPDAHEPRRELAHRVNDGLEVQLLWDPTDDSVDVVVADHRTGVVFELPVARDRALDAFIHPFVYAV